MKSTMEQLKAMVDVDTVIGNPIPTASGGVILPVSRVTLGFLSGGGEYGKSMPVKRANQDMEPSDELRPLFAGTSTAALSLTPMAFLVIENGRVKMMPAEPEGGYERLIEMIPQAISDIIKAIRERHDNKTN